MAVTQYLWDVVDDNLLAELDENGDVVVSYTNEPGLYGQPISMHRGGQSYFFQYDGSGNVVAVTDENGDVVEETTYNAFGEVVDQTSSITNPYGYKGAFGYYTNPETNDIYVRARAHAEELNKTEDGHDGHSSEATI
jgi:YD repeat-containing protein